MALSGTTAQQEVPCGHQKCSAPIPSRDTREKRALALYRAHGGRIERIWSDAYLVPSQDGERAYRVRYGDLESCDCPDFEHRGRGRALACVHIYAVGIHRAKRRSRTAAL